MKILHEMFKKLMLIKEETLNNTIDNNNIGAPQIQIKFGAFKLFFSFF